MQDPLYNPRFVEDTFCFHYIAAHVGLPALCTPIPYRPLFCLGTYIHSYGTAKVIRHRSSHCRRASVIMIGAGDDPSDHDDTASCTYQQGSG